MCVFQLPVSAQRVKCVNKTCAVMTDTLQTASVKMSSNKWLMTLRNFIIVFHKGVYLPKFSNQWKYHGHSWHYWWWCYNPIFPIFFILFVTLNLDRDHLFSKYIQCHWERKFYIGNIFASSDKCVCFFFKSISWNHIE